MGIKKLRERKCDRWKKVFYWKLVPNKETGEKQLGKINEVDYWTGGKGWKNYKILCRLCLNDWFENNRLDFADLVEKDKQKLFYHYRYLGFFKKSKELYKEE